MKTALIKFGRLRSFLHAPVRRFGVLAALLVATAPLSLTAQIVVDTLTGGPSHFYPKTSDGYTNGNTATDAKFNHPLGLALDSTGNKLFVADRDNNAVRLLDLAANQTFTFATESINKPVGVAIDSADNVYVLNRGSGTDGSVLQFNIYADPPATIASGLTNAAGIALDGSGNIYVTVNSNTLVRITQSGVITPVTEIPYTDTSLQGLIVKHDGNIAICDAGRHGIYLVNPTNGIFSTIAGFHGAGDFTTANNVASSPTAKFKQPTGVTEAGDGTLVVTDTGNHRVKVVLTNGVVRNLYGVSSNYWVQGSASQGIFPGWWDGTVLVPDVLGDVEAREPSGIVFAPDGKVYVTEVYYHLIRHATTGLPLPPPAAPKDLRATATVGQVALFWSASTGATSYNVKRSQSSGGPYTTIASTTTTNYTDANVLDGTTYYYVVSALNAYGEGSNSEEVSATTPFPPVPNPQIGYVEFPPPTFRSVFHPVSLAGVTFNNDKPIVIVGANGSQTFYTYSNTLNAASVPDPTGSSASAPVGYLDGLFQSTVSILTVASILPELTIKAIGEQSGRSNSAIVSAQFQFIVGNPNISGDNAAQFTVSDITQGADLWYTSDGSEPTNAAPSLFAGTSSGTNAITLSLSFPVGATNMTVKVRGFKANYQPSALVSQTFSASNFDANKITFGFAAGEASSDFIASPGQFFYAPVTLSIVSDATMYSLQFNLTVTNTGPNPGPAVAPGAFRFESFLEKPDPANPAFFIRIPPAMFTQYTTNFASITTNGSTFLVTNLTPNFTSLVFANNNLLGVGWLERFGKTNLYDTKAQDLIKYSQPHDTLFLEDNGKVVLGGYAFRVPGSAQISNTYQIQIGRPSATSDGIGAPGSDVYIATPTNGSLTVGAVNAIKNVTVGQRKYIAGDSAPFRWFNAGDFGNTNLNSSDVEQVFQSAIYFLNYPPLGSDFFDSMDSCGATFVNNGNGYLEFGSTSTNTAVLFNGGDTTIDQIAFGDGVLDVCDVYVTFRRSLDPSLKWFRRFWTNGVRVAETVGNPPQQPPPPAAPVPAVSVNFASGDFTASAGQTIQIPVTAKISGTYPIRTLMLNLSVNPLDGSSALTSPVQFAPNPALGLPAITSSKGNGNYAATWLNSAISGLTGNATLGTLTVQVPANAPSSAAYAVHFDHASASPNGLASFPKQTQNGLITLSDRSASSWNDGIPDAWRLRHFGSIYNVLSAPDADADSDGVVNLDEFRAGTDPNNAQSKLKLLTSPSLNNGLFKISWPTVLNKRYVLEGSSTLYGDSWTVIATNIVGDGNLKEFLDTNNPMPFRFYRVKAE